jgi:DNA-binding Xre family transcriptional regulator
MDREITPIYGWMQPTLGRSANLIYLPVGKAKAPKGVSAAARRARELVGQNIKHELDRAFPHKSLTYGFLKVGESTGLSLSTLQRICAGKVGCQLDTLADIAHTLGCSMADLFVASKDGLLGLGPEAASQQRLQRRGKKK